MKSKTTRLRTGTTNLDYLYDASGNMTREITKRNFEWDYGQRSWLFRGKNWPWQVGKNWPCQVRTPATGRVAEQSPVVSGLVPSESDLASSSEPKSFFEKVDQAFYQFKGPDSGEMTFEQGQKIMGGTASVFLAALTILGSTGFSLVISYLSIGSGIDDIFSNSDNESGLEQIFPSEEGKAIISGSKAAISFASGKTATAALLNRGSQMNKYEKALNNASVIESYKSTFESLKSTVVQTDSSFNKIK